MKPGAIRKRIDRLRRLRLLAANRPARHSVDQAFIVFALQSQYKN